MLLDAALPARIAESVRLAEAATRLLMESYPDTGGKQ
jgi:hypothetical protein